MIQIRKLLLISMLVSATCSTVSLPQANPMGPQPTLMPGQAAPAMPADMPAMSEEDARAMEELNKMVQDVEQYRQSLPPDQRAQFDHEAQEAATRMQTRMDEMLKQDPALEERLKNQDPEALDMFLQNVFGPEIERAAEEEQAVAGPNAPAPIEPGPSAPEEPAKKAEKKAVKQIDLHDALELTDSIIEYLESFKDKTTIIITLQGLYEKWAKDDRLKGWKKEFTWAKFKEKIDHLTASFYELKLKDPDTKEYRHLADLLEDKELYQLLKQFNDDLADNEPRITTPAAGIGELNSASKDAARETINVCLRGITKVQEQLTALIEKYGATAKKITTEKEKERQKAEAAMKQRKPGYTHAIGVGERNGSAYNMPYPDQQYTPYTPWSGPSTPTPQQEGSHDMENKKLPETPKTPPSAGAPAKKEGGPHEKALDRTFEDFNEGLSSIANTIDDNKNLKNFGSYMANATKGGEKETATAIKAVQEEIKKITNTIRRSCRVHIPHLDSSTKNRYIKDFEEAINKATEQASLRALISDIESIDKSRSRTNSKKLAFFDEETRQTLRAAQQKGKGTVDEYAEAEGSGASIFTLRDDFNKLKKAIQDLKTLKQIPASKESSGAGASSHQPQAPE